MFSLIVFTLIMVSIFFYLFFLQTVKEREIEYAVNSSSGAKQSMNVILDLVNDTSDIVSMDKDIINILSKAQVVEDAEYKNIKNRNDIKLQDMVSSHEYIKGIYIIGNNGQTFTSDWQINEKVLKEEFGNNIHSSEYYTGVHATPYHLFSKDSVISYVEPIYLYPSRERLGIVIIDLDLTKLREIFATSSIREDEKVVIVNSKRETLFTFPYNVNLDQVISDNDEIMKLEKVQLQKEVFGKKSIIVSDTFNNSDWKIVRIINFERIYTAINKILISGVFLLFILLIISLIVSLILSASITRPIIELNNEIKKVEKGDLSVNIFTKRKDELGELSESFNKMVVKLKDLINRMLKEQKKKANMEFKILQAQINPHFLYNTLDSIRWLAVIQNVPNISEMTSALINLLIYNISNESTVVTLKEEIEGIKNYETIQKYRYGDTFSIEFNIHEETLNYKVLKFILQPLVENAIFHGIDTSESEGKIKIVSEIDGNDLVIQVIDNGVGMDVEKCMDTSTKKKMMHTGIGLKNIEERIKLYFGDEYGIVLSSEKDVGTTVKVILPLVRTEDDIIEKIKIDDSNRRMNYELKA